MFVTVKDVVDTEREAADEVARLNALNANKGSVYFHQRGRRRRQSGRDDEDS